MSSIGEAAADLLINLWSEAYTKGHQDFTEGKTKDQFPESYSGGEVTNWQRGWDDAKAGRPCAFSHDKAKSDIESANFSAINSIILVSVAFVFVLFILTAH